MTTLDGALAAISEYTGPDDVSRTRFFNAFARLMSFFVLGVKKRFCIVQVHIVFGITGA